MGKSPTSPHLVESFPLAAIVGERLRGRGVRVAVAESCTGGLLGASLTAVPGSSDYFLGGVIAYDNRVKEELLGVPAALLAAHGAVSAEVALAMAQGVRRALSADVGLAITGVAGPGEDSANKAAGLIFIARAGPDGDDHVRLDADHGREGNRAAAVQAALELLTAL